MQHAMLTADVHAAAWCSPCEVHSCMGGSDEECAAAGKQAEPAEISLHSHSLQSSSIAVTINTLSNSIINADSSDVVFMHG